MISSSPASGSLYATRRWIGRSRCLQSLSRDLFPRDCFTPTILFFIIGSAHRDVLHKLFFPNARADPIGESNTIILCTFACGMSAILAQASNISILIGPVADTLFNIRMCNSVHSQVFYAAAMIVNRQRDCLYVLGMFWEHFRVTVQAAL